ncbi:hypothetical protein B5P44_00200 [Mycobacterium sp. CBMA 213]|uniref:Uncharacterized protein n=1 Tax=Mycolicibacterium sp. CBMA 213 TaxID=1968788 RepID=A0A343VR17_9MYCO|nr:MULTISPECIES: hypothetical protein [unclassified Mycolicibacterium]AVN58341.1 hypothetical protein B5P44_p00046 [Mycolicibacterium sp. CBMA 213]MUL61006.1 hypothetical protein [Mycolicibacterium sp. CBMA 335]MUM03243.1 hypothetical protein [Mycolicibacterium sp. CBMA 213]
MSEQVQADDPEPAGEAVRIAGQCVLITPKGTFRVRDTVEADDVICLMMEMLSDPVDEPLVAMSRQQVAVKLGRGIPADFPQGGDVVTGDPRQGGTRGWWESTVQRYLDPDRATPDGEEDDTPADAETDADTATPTPGYPTLIDPNAWPAKSRQWDDVDFSGADHRVLLVTAKGIVTPSGLVKSAPLSSPGRVGEIVCRRQWSTPPGGADPQLWMFPEALEAIGFPLVGQTKDGLPAYISEFFGCKVKYNLAGWYSCEFDGAVYGGQTRTADLVMLPYLGLDPSSSRPKDRGVAGIQGTATEYPDDPDEAAHVLGDRIAWLNSIEGAVPASRWSQVGAHLAKAKMDKARPKPKNTEGKPPALKPCPLPAQISSTGKLPDPWWGSEGVEILTDDEGVRQGVRVKKPPHRSRDKMIDVEMDQQAAYLPSAGIYLGYGEPFFIPDPDPAEFDKPQPHFGMHLLTTPPGRELDLNPKLPLPHPQMKWDEQATWWANTTDIRQMTAPVEGGGAGIACPELQIEMSYVWPEQHQWLSGFVKELRSLRIEAELAGRLDYQQMIKAIYTSFLGRLEAVGDGAWKYPLLHLQQPAWYGAMQSETRFRSMRYATRIGREHGIYPVGWWVDAWFYRVPADFDLKLLEEPCNDKGTLDNGKYRIKNTFDPSTPAKSKPKK